MASYLPFLLLIGSVLCVPLVNEYEDNDRAMQNPDLFEGDILGVEPDTDRNAIANPDRLWDNGVIPYRIMPDIMDQEDLIKKAMKHIEDNTCIRFRPATKKDWYSIKIYRGQGCFSIVGMLYDEQPVSLGDGCHLHATVVHELMHAIGFYHEHSRSDRDDYINIHWENIAPKFRVQFVKLKPDKNILFDSFDYESIMLYSETVFSYNGLKTMTSKKPGFTIPNIYTKPGLSKSDIYRVKKLYKCK